MSSNPSAPLPTDIDVARIPRHIAFIMDGNGRWARKRLLNRVKGHERGAETVRTVVRTCRKIGVSHVTLYAFSTENWERPQSEIAALMTLLKRFLVQETDELLENDIRLNAIGQVERLPGDVRETLAQVMAATEQKTAMTLNLALSYGGRLEIVEMVRKIAQAVKDGAIDPEAVSHDLVARHLYTWDMPDPDLLIRTSGEMRVSNFLLWQIAYAEIFITPTLWPDFNRDELLDIVRWYQSRERRFGWVT